PTGLVPETEGVEGGPPDLALRDPRLLVEDPESPGPAVGVHPLRPPFRVEVVRVLAHGADVDDEGEVTPWRGGGVELEVLAARHVAPGRLEDGRHRTPAALGPRGRRVAEGEVEDRLGTLRAGHVDLPVDLPGEERTDDAAGGIEQVVLPDEGRGGRDVEHRREHVRRAGRIAGPGAEAPGVAVEAERELVARL